MRTAACVILLVSCLGNGRRVHLTSRQVEVDKAAEFLASLLPVSRQPAAGWHVIGSGQGVGGAHAQLRLRASPAHRACVSMQTDSFDACGGDSKQQAGADLSRRAVLAPLLAAVLASQASPLPASAAVKLKDYTFERFGVSWKIPEDWEPQTVEQQGGQIIVVAPDPDDTETSVAVVFTPVRPDLAAIGSVGTSYFRSLFIPTCDGEPCKLAKGDFSEGNVLSEETLGDKSLYDYTINQRNGRKNRIKTLFTVKRDPQGASSIIVGLNIQTRQSRFKDLEPLFKDVIDSLKK